MHLVDPSKPAQVPTLDAALDALAVEQVPATEAAATPEKNNVVKAHFGRLSVPEQLRAIADSLEGVDDSVLDHMVVVFASGDPNVSSIVKVGGNKDVHPFFISGMLQNAALIGLDEAANMAFEAEAGLSDD